MRIPQGPTPAGMGRVEMLKMLQKENPGIKLEGRLPELMGKPRVTGIEFTVSDIAEAKRLVFKGMRWNGHVRKVEVVTGAEEKSPARTPGSGPKSRPQAPWNEAWRSPRGQPDPARPGVWRGKSAVQCFNCQGYGHIAKVCSSAARKAAQKIDKMEKGKGKGKKVAEKDEDYGYDDVARKLREYVPARQKGSWRKEADGSKEDPLVLKVENKDNGKRCQYCIAKGWKGLYHTESECRTKKREKARAKKAKAEEEEKEDSDSEGVTTKMIRIGKTKNGHEGLYEYDTAATHHTTNTRQYESG